MLKGDKLHIESTQCRSINIYSLWCIFYLRTYSRMSLLVCLNCSTVLFLSLKKLNFLHCPSSTSILFFQDWGEHIRTEEQLLQQPFDASGTEQPLQLQPLQVAYAQVMDGPMGERELLLQRLQLRVSNDAQAVVVEWQFVGNLNSNITFCHYLWYHLI